MQQIVRFIRDETGQGTTEYAIIVVVITAVAAGAVIFLGDKLKAIFTAICY